MIKNIISKKFLTNNSLKIIASLSMLIDHAAKIVLIPWLYIKVASDNSNFDFYNQLFKVDFIKFGRIAMPIFAFLLVEGFIHTKDFKKHLLRMLCFAILTEPIYDQSIHILSSIQENTPPLFYIHAQNILFTFSLGLIMMWFLKFTKEEYKNKYICASISIGIIAFCATVSQVFKFDYGCYGILIIAFFYLLRFNRFFQSLSFLALYIIDSHSFSSVFILSTCILILLYNGKKGALNLKSFFYSFYPLHLLILHAIALFYIYT